jgi:hypothetical protein
LGEAREGIEVKANEAQAGDDWLRQRAGAFTASRADDLMARTKTGPSASRANLLALLAVERLTGECVPTYRNAAMDRGIEMEAEARDAYSFHEGVVVEECGYVPHPTIARCGCSPDGFVDDGLVEFKCPSSMQKHLDALRSGDHARDYKWQLQHQLMVTCRAWVDVVSYDPRFPDGLQLAVMRVTRDESAIAQLCAEIAKADAEVEAIVAELMNLKRAA